VIRFKCIYCGQRILAKDDGAGRKGKCPKCAHLLVVPHSTRNRPAISADIPEKLPQPSQTDAVSSPAEDSQEAQLHSERSGWFIPTYDEMSLFLTSVVLILLAVLNSQLRSDAWKFVRSFDDWRIIFWVVIVIAGLCLCLYHPFTTRKKNPAEKYLMLFFAVLANAGAGLAAGNYVIEHSSGWPALFAVWNIINSILLLAMLRFKIIDYECIADRDATPVQVVLGLTVVLVIFIVLNYVLKLYWAITFSVCIIYTTSFDKALQSVLPGFTAGSAEQ